MWELNYKEGWVPKNWCFWIGVLEKTLESSLDSKEIKPAHLKGDQPWILTARTDAKGEASVFRSSDVNRQLIGKVPDAGKDWGQKVKRCQRMRCLDIITNAMNMYLGKLQEMVRDREAWCAVVHGVSKSQTGLSNWTDVLVCLFGFIFYRILCASRTCISCPVLCHPMDWGPPGSSVHGTLQARILEWVAISYSRGSSPPRDGTCVSCVSCIGRWILYQYATWLGNHAHRYICNQFMSLYCGFGIFFMKIRVFEYLVDSYLLIVMDRTQWWEV